MSIHAPISASRLQRVMLCKGSYQMELGMPNKTNVHAQRGTDCHAMAEKLYHGIEVKTDDTEALQWATDYVAYVKAIGGQQHIEINLTGPLQQVHELLGGTADAIIFKDDELHVVDLKSGRGKVNVTSPQLKCYALGAWLWAGRPNVTVKAHIWCPHYAIQEPAQYSVADLEAFINELQQLVEDALDPFVEVTPSYEACRYCLAKTVCPSMKDLAVKTAQADFNLQTDMSDLPELLDTAEMLEGWINSVRESAKDLLSTGAFIQGWELSQGRKMSKIRNETEVIAHFEGNQRLYTLKSLTQLKKDGFDVPKEYIEESLSASSLKRSK